MLRSSKRSLRLSAGLIVCSGLYEVSTDAAGRPVIPPEIRREAGFQPGMSLDVRWHDGRVEIEPSALPVNLIRKGRLLVAVPQEDVEQLTTETVEETRQTLTQERASQD